MKLQEHVKIPFTRSPLPGREVRFIFQAVSSVDIARSSRVRLCVATYETT